MHKISYRVVVWSHCYAGLQCGDTVSVVCDLDGKCLRGSTEYNGQILHVGNGIARFSRQNLFGSNPNTRYV